jgi:hypothetical protein
MYLKYASNWTVISPQTNKLTNKFKPVTIQEVSNKRHFLKTR